jgi:hypothetical protein
MDEVEELVGQGLDAMCEAFYAGNEGVSVVFGNEKVALEGLQGSKKEDNSDDDDKNKSKIEDEPSEIAAAGEGVLDEEEVCLGCFENPCVFFIHEERLVAFDAAEYSMIPAGEDVPSNNVRRKKLYRQLTLMLNDGPLGAGVRRPLPNCCVSAIRYMLPSPSETYMGFREE